MKHKLKQNRELKIIKEKANNFHSTIKFTSIHRWDVRDGDRFFGHKNVQWGSSFNKELILDVQIYYKQRGAHEPTEDFHVLVSNTGREEMVH